MTKMTKNPTTVTIGPVRLSYEHLWEPAIIGDNPQAKYSASLIVPKGDKATIATINEAVDAAIERGVASKWSGKRPKNLKTPLRDGDIEREDDAYSDAMFFNASSSAQNPPKIVNARKQPILDTSEVYSGCYGYVSVTFYPFDASGNRGVAAGLNIFAKTKDGEALASRISVDEAFDGIDLSSDGEDEFD